MIYGYIENGALIAEDFNEIQREYIDSNGKRSFRTESIEDQIKERGDLWKHVDDIDEERANKIENGYCTRIVPYDAGDHISFSYQLIPDLYKYNNTIQKLKDELSASDYKIIKCYEASLVGKELPYNILEVHSERQALRDRINELETDFLAMQERS